MFNADGSESEMCGNGIRCVAKYVYDHGIADKRQLKIETGAGVLSLDLEMRRRQGRSACASTWASRSSKPARSRSRCRAGSGPRSSTCRWRRTSTLDNHDGWIEACGLDPRMTCVSMGNPHVMLYCRDVAAGAAGDASGRCWNACRFFPSGSTSISCRSTRRAK